MCYKRISYNDKEAYMKITKKSLLILLSIINCLNLTGCLYGNNARNTNTSNVYTSTDIQAISNMFPGLEGVESAEWEEIKRGGDGSRLELPGPTDYEYHGYITISDESAEKYSNEYTFTSATPNVPFEALIAHDSSWLYSQDFTKDIIGNYSGYVWFDGKKILFSINSF